MTTTKEIKREGFTEDEIKGAIATLCAWRTDEASDADLCDKLWALARDFLGVKGNG